MITIEDDLGALAHMIYSGRGLIVGMTPNGVPFIGYSLTGRSPESKARILEPSKSHRVIRTVSTDPRVTESGNAALLLYPALIAVKDGVIGANGVHSELLYTHYRHAAANGPIDLDSVVQKAFAKPEYRFDPKEDKWIDITEYEPDKYHTPRISAVVDGTNGIFHIVKMDNTGKPLRQFHKVIQARGKAQLLTTYLGDNKEPLQSFADKPLALRIASNSPEAIAGSIYQAITKVPPCDYHVAAAVMMRMPDGTMQTSIVNRGV